MRGHKPLTGAGAPTDPLPDEVRIAFEVINSIIGGTIKEEETIRTHIATLESKLAKLTKDPPYKSIRAKLLGNYTAKMKSDNKRLRSLLKSANRTYLGDQYVACIDPRAIDIALAQTDGKDGE